MVRPDGLILCRVTDLSALSDVARHLKSGTAPTGGIAPSRVEGGLSSPESTRERVWLGLSRALDSAAESDREGMLTRLAMLLGDKVGHEVFEELLEVAQRTAKTARE